MPKIIEGAKGIVTKKIGPAPVWVYVVVGAGAVFILRARGGGAGAGNAGTISIPTLSPGATTDSLGGGSVASGGNAVGSPSQNLMAGAETQPGATAPPWWWSATPAPGAKQVPTAITTKQPGQVMPQKSATAGVAPTPAQIKANIAPTVTPWTPPGGSVVDTESGPAYKIAQPVERPGGYGLIPADATIVNVSGGGAPSGQGTSRFQDLINVPISLSNWAVQMLGLGGNTPPPMPASPSPSSGGTLIKNLDGSWTRMDIPRN